MPDIELDKEENALFEETGSRGDAFRRATQDRLEESSRVTRRLNEIVDDHGAMIGQKAEPGADPEPQDGKP